jgi:hypothetical protein
MIEKAKALGEVLLGGAIFVGILALAVVFIMGSLWASRHLLQPLIVIGWIALALNILILLPLSVFKRLRGYTGSGIFLSSYIFGLVAWLLGFILTYALWGLSAVIVGIVFLGGGVVPIALLATLFKGLWEPFFTLLALTAITFGSRVSGLLIAGSASK